MHQWERVEWQYAKVLDIETAMREPAMIELRKTSNARYQQKMAARFPIFFEHYTRIFMKLVNGKLNKQLYLLCLKQKARIDSGEIDFEKGNREIIDDQVNRLLKKLPDELHGKIQKTYNNLKEEDVERRKKEEQEALDIMSTGQPRTQVVEVVEETTEDGKIADEVVTVIE